MTETKKRYWQEQGWDPLSPRRKYPWRLSECSDWQDVLSTYDCLLGKAGDMTAPKPDAEREG